jgi:HD-GYP domain-containing protein (c-di-GMP phosphodiesterase class II)
LDRETGEVVPFSKEVQPIIEALASQAAVSLDNQQLIQAQKDLLEAFIKVIAHAIDRKSPYTGGHCERVPVITEMLTEAAIKDQNGPFRGFSMNDEEWYELHIAAWLHDCGKVTTPEYVVDKATKLETIYDRIETVRTRFEVLKRDAEIAYLRACMAPEADQANLKAEYDAQIAALEEDRQFIETANIGGEFMDDADIDRIHRIAQAEWVDWSGQRQPFLSDNEVHNLTIRRGTLTDEERKIINDHIVVTIDMLEQLPFPRHLRRVPEYAGGHHEKMDGTGYPRGLTKDQMSVPARIMAIADIFEALTAGDRPYKKAKKLSEAIKIMSYMKKDNHIDPELFDLFLSAGVYLKYAQRYLPPDLIDEVPIDQYISTPGLQPAENRPKLATG